MTPYKSTWLPIAVIAGLLVIAGCGSSDEVGSARSASTSTGSLSPVITSAASIEGAASTTVTGPATELSGAAEAGTGSPLSVPLTTVVGADGSTRVLVDISVGGGAPVPVVLDTGSSGLMIDETAVGLQIDTGASQPYKQDYVNSSITGTLIQASVTIAGVSTPPVGVVTFTADNASAGLTSGEARGVMGIASSAKAGGTPDLWSPSLQLPVPYNEASTLDVAATGAGTWILGPTAPLTGSVAVPLVAVPGAPDTAARWAKDVQLCWTIGSNPQGCGPTDFDTGAPSGIINTTVLASAPAVGTAISVATPGGPALWSFTTTDTATAGKMKSASLGATTSYNTGLQFFFTHVVSYDYAAGTVNLASKT